MTRNIFVNDIVISQSTTIQSLGYLHNMNKAKINFPVHQKWYQEYHKI